MDKETMIKTLTDGIPDATLKASIKGLFSAHYELAVTKGKSNMEAIQIAIDGVNDAFPGTK